MNLERQINEKLYYKIDLNYEELCYVFNNIAQLALKFPYHAKVYKAVVYLLENLRGNQRTLLVKVLNKYFLIYPRYRISLETLEDVFDCWRFKCDKKVGNLLIDMAGKLHENVLDEFKNSFPN